MQLVELSYGANVQLTGNRLYCNWNTGGCDMQTKCEQATRDVREKLSHLEMCEKTAVRLVMTEEQARFSFFVNCLKPVMVNVF